MISGYIDGFLCACPPKDAAPHAFYEFVNSLLEWRDVRLTPAISLFSSTKTFDVLEATGFLPLWGPIAESIQAAGITDVQAKDVVGLVNALLMKTATIEDVLGLDEFLCGSDCFQLPWTEGVRPREFDDLTRHLILAMGFRARVVDQEPRRHVLLTRGCTEGSVVSVDADVDDAEGNCRCNFAFPVELNHQFRAATKISTLWSGLDAGEICLYAMEKQDASLLALAIQEEISRRSAIPRRWSVHSKFGESLWGLGGARTSSVARAITRACAETVLEESMFATHHLRKGSGGGDGQRRRGRDGAGAWRRDIDFEFHLHYWATPDGPELASVVAHAEMSIPE